jgi:hypothetical protein
MVVNNNDDDNDDDDDVGMFEHNPSPSRFSNLSMLRFEVLRDNFNIVLLFMAVTDCSQDSERGLR